MSAIRCPALPIDTARAAESAFGKEHAYLKIGESLIDLLSGLDTDSLASADQRLADSFWPYSLATILQYWEDLTDHQMSNATRIRVDLKYALHLPLSFPGIDSLALCRFRQRLLLNPAGKEVFHQLVNCLADVVMNQDKHPGEADLILSAVCTLNRWEMVVETMSNAIEALAASQPEWLRCNALPHWYKRYDKRMPAFQTHAASQNAEDWLFSVGKDGQYLLDAVQKSGLPALTQMRELQVLAQEWHCQFDQEGHQLRLRTVSCPSCPTGFERIVKTNSENGRGGLCRKNL